MAISMLLGGAVGLFLLFSVVTNPADATVAVLVLLGVIAVEAVRQAIR